MNAQQKEEMVREFKASAHLRKRLTELLEEKRKTNKTYASSKDRYELSSWSYLQADAVGFERALTEIISIISE